MTSSTSTPPRKRAAKPKSAAIEPGSFLEIIQWIDTEVLVERALELRILTLGLLSGTNVHLIGLPGIAKSLGLRVYIRCITGATLYEKTIHAQTPADAIVGGYDMEKFANGGGLMRKVEGAAPMADVVFISEMPRGNGPTLDSLLSLWNTEERLYDHNGGMALSRIKFAVSDSNTWFDADNTQAMALSDRVTLMLEVHDIKSDESFKDMLRRHHARNEARFGGAPVVGSPMPTITLEQLEQAQAEVAGVRLGAEFLDAFAKLRRDAKGEGLNISPRRWTELARVCRASAWMAGRTECQPDDLVVCEHGMWREKKDIPTASKLVQEYHGRFVREAREKRAEAAKPIKSVEEIRPQVEGTPASQELDAKVIKAAINASRAIDEVKLRVETVLAEAEREKRDASDLRDLDNELLAIQKWFKANNLPTRYSGT